MGGSVVVISGPAGAGKTTVGALVAGSFDPSAHIQTDVFATFVVNGWIDQWLPDAARQGEVLGRAVAVTTLALAEGGYTVVLDGNFFPDGVEGLGHACTGRGVPVYYAVLRPPLDSCISRVALRGEREVSTTVSRQQARFDTLGTTEGERLLRQQYHRFEDLGRYEGHVVAAAGGPDEVAAVVVAALTAGEIRVA